MRLLAIILISLIITVNFTAVHAQQIGVKPGYWVKYSTSMEIEGDEILRQGLMQAMSDSSFTAANNRPLNEIDWLKVQIEDVSDSQVKITKSINYQGTEEKEPSMWVSVPNSKTIPFVMPTEMKVGDRFPHDMVGYINVVDTENRKYGDKERTVYVMQSNNITNLDEETGALVEIKTVSYYDQSTGFLLEYSLTMSLTTTVGYADIIVDFDAIDYSLLSNSSGGGCLIATAAYGSELAPQVQQLRELRDNKLLQTESGSKFMAGFNDFYYSFSPTVADFERENPIFKEAVKLAVTPMISSLSLLNQVDMDSESEVLGYGISLILLNVGMYVGVPAIIVMGIRKHAP